MRTDPITENLALWLLFALLAIAGLTHLPQVVNTIRQVLAQPVQTTSRKVSL